MSIKLITTKSVTLVTVLCLATSLAMTSCGKKEASVADNAITDAGKTVGGAAVDAGKTVGGAAVDTAKTAGGAAVDAGKTASNAVTGAAAGVGAALSGDDKTKLTPVKTALVMANSAVKSGDMGKAKAQFEKFNGLWTMVEPMVKAKAGANYPAIETGLNMVKTAMGSATPDKAKAGKGLTDAITAITAVMDKK